MTKPNILVIMADQQRIDCLGAYGNLDIQTPHIDSLAVDGARYTDSFCPFPVCTPSRYSFLSGLYVRQHLGGSNHCTLPAGLPTFPRILQEAGYRTKAAGKMHFTPTYLDVGFDEMMLAEQNGPGRYDDDYHRWLMAEGLYDAIDLMDQEREFRQIAPPEYWETVGALQSNLDEAHHSTTWIGDRALEALQTWDRSNNLLMVSFIKPHHPFDPPAPWSQMYDPEALSLLPGWLEACLPRDLVYHTGYFPHQALTERKVRRATAYYYATISHIDHQVGRMLEYLKQQNLYDDALILYTSDHGEYLGFHHLLLKGNHMYDPLVKVPLIIKYPQGARAGQVSEGLVNNIDIAPTLIQAAGGEAPSSMAGASLLESQQRGLVFAEAGRGSQYMVRSRTRKLLLCQDEAQSLFFDLEADPLEMDNRIAEPVYQDDVQAMREALFRWLAFECLSPVHLAESAPVIQADNVPPRNNAHRAGASAYFRDKMARYYDGTPTNNC